MNTDERVLKIEKRLDKLEEKVNEAIPEIQAGIKEIKVLLQERPKQEDLKNSLLEKDIINHDNRLKKIENNQDWLWKTLAGAIITTIIGAIIFVIKMM